MKVWCLIPPQLIVTILASSAEIVSIAFDIIPLLPLVAFLAHVLSPSADFIPSSPSVVLDVDRPVGDFSASAVRADPLKSQIESVILQCETTTSD